LPRAWDGSGHYVRAQLYAQHIFPDTFGWVPNFYAGMPFPNYYPPCFYWLVGALARFPPLSLHAAFVLVLAVSALLIPVAVWSLTRGAARRSAVATLAAVAVFPLLFDKRSFFPLGLSYPGTFLVGLYTQPLGFIFLALWYRSLLRASRPFHWFGAALLLALVFISNLFAAAPAMMLWASTVGYNLFRATRARAPRARERLVAIAARQVACLALALLLAGFWLFPALAHGAFFVTRPVETPGSELINPLLPAWYAAAAAGTILWLRRPTAAAVPMVLTLALGYAGLLIFRLEVLLPWFPLQIPRFLTCLNFLLAVPVGIALSEAAGRLISRVRPRGYRYAPVPVAVAAIALLLVLRVAVQTANHRLAFYSSANGDFRRVEPILRFAQAHRDGRYLVEQVPFSLPGPSLDSRAISSYLGMQGNDAASIACREASISSLFINPLIGAMSAGKDNFGLSSILAEDRDFLSQSMERHLQQAGIYRMRYVVMFSESAKRRLARLPPDRYAKYDFGEWSVFELRAPPRPEAMPLARRPVLVLTSFSAKLTRRSDYHFLRLAQEEFVDSPGVPIAFHPDYRADRLPDPETVSALVVESYRYRSINAAFEEIKRFSQKKPVVLVEADDPLFRTLRDRQGALGKVSAVARIPAKNHGWIGTGAQAVSYRQDAVRQTWRNVKAALEASLQQEEPRPAANCQMTRMPDTLRIRCDGDAPVGVGINCTYHPNWRAAGGQPVLLLSPSLMYTVVRGTAELRFCRTAADLAALVLSALTLVAGLGWAVLGRPRRRQLKPGTQEGANARR